MSLLTRARLRAIIIEWLGAAYDNDMPGNPDYRNDQEVEELVSKIMEAMK